MLNGDCRGGVSTKFDEMLSSCEMTLTTSAPSLPCKSQNQYIVITSVEAADKSSEVRIEAVLSSQP